jgi:hypothetical protein
MKELTEMEILVFQLKTGLPSYFERTTAMIIIHTRPKHQLRISIIHHSRNHLVNQFWARCDLECFSPAKGSFDFNESELLRMDVSLPEISRFAVVISSSEFVTGVDDRGSIATIVSNESVLWLWTSEPSPAGTSNESGGNRGKYILLYGWLEEDMSLMLLNRWVKMY